MKKFSQRERNFFCSRAAFKSSFLQLLMVMRFDCISFRLVLIGIEGFK